jgi:hypothetical protein
MFLTSLHLKEAIDSYQPVAMPLSLSDIQDRPLAILGGGVLG